MSIYCKVKSNKKIQSRMRMQLNDLIQTFNNRCQIKIIWSDLLLQAESHLDLQLDKPLVNLTACLDCGDGLD